MRLNELKSYLYNSVKDTLADIEELELTRLKKDTFAIINKILSDEYLSKNGYDSIGIGLNLDIVFPKEEAERLESKLLNRYYEIVNISKNMSRFPELEEDLIKSVKKFDAFRKKLLELEQESNERISYLSNKISIEKPRMITFKRILSALKYGSEVTREQKKMALDFAKSLNIDDADRIILEEQINIHNKKVTDPDANIKTYIIDLLKYDYEEYEISEEHVSIFEKKAIREMIKSYTDLIEVGDVNIEDVIEMLPTSESLGINQFNYIFKSIMNKYIATINECKKNMSDMSVYKDKDIKNVVIMVFVSTRHKLYNIRKFYNEENKKYIESIEVDDEQAEEHIEENDNNQVVFLTLPDSSESYFERDIINMNEDYISKTWELIESYRNGTLSSKRKKKFTNNEKLKGYHELKDADQVRVVYRIQNGVSIILGADIKKADIDLPLLYSITGRDRKIGEEDISMMVDNAERASKNIETYIEKHARKGGR